MSKKAIGWQIANKDGYSIHGDQDDPFELASYEVLVGDARTIADEWCANHPGYRLIAIREGDIEEPEIINTL